MKTRKPAHGAGRGRARKAAARHDGAKSPPRGAAQTRHAQMRFEPSEALAKVDLRFEDNGASQALFGPGFQNLEVIERELGVKISTRGAHVFLSGEPLQVARARKVLLELYALAEFGHRLTPSDVTQALGVIAHDDAADDASLKALMHEGVIATGGLKSVRPKTLGQRRYIEAMRRCDLVFGIGPAGTGKTYLAVAMAVSALTRNQVRRIVLARPAVEAGEKLGFLPGDMAEKVNPYLRPLRDALDDLLGAERAFGLLERGVIELAPLAFMRGRTLSDAFVILDESQNTTAEQMKMFLTRFGFGSKVVVTGDVTQSDLPRGVESGLRHAERILREVQGVGFCHLGAEDVVRHPLVSRIVQAYDRARGE